MAEQFQPLKGLFDVQEEEQFNPFKGLIEDSQADMPEEFTTPPSKTFNNSTDAETEEALSFQKLSADEEYMDMLRDYGKKGNLGQQKDDESNEEYLKRFLTHTREFEFNSIDLGRQLDWVRNANQQDRMEFGYLYQQLGRLPSFYQEGGTGYASAIKDFGKSLLLDPLSYLGFGAGKVGSFIAQRAIVQALKTGGKKAAIKEAAKYNAKGLLKSKAGKIVGTGIVAEGGVVALQDLKLQELEMLSKKYGEYTPTEYDLKRTGIVGGVGLAFGYGGAKLSGGLGGKQLLTNARQSVIKQKKIAKELTSREASILGDATDAAKKRATEATSQVATGVFDIDAGRQALESLGDISPDATRLAKISFNTELMKRVGKVVEETVEELASNGKLGDMVDEDTKASEVIGKLVNDALDKIGEDASPEAIEAQTKKLFKGELGKKLSQVIQTDDKGVVVDSVSGDALQAAISRAGLTTEQFVNAMGASYSDAGSFLQTASKVGKIIKSLGMVDKELAEVLLAARPGDKMLTGMAQMHGLMTRLDRERRALMVTQIATTVRNVGTGVTRLTFETAANGMESVLYNVGRGFDAAMTGNQPLGSGFIKNVVRDSFGRLDRLRRVADTADLSEALLKHNPRLASRMDRTLQEASDDETLSGFTRMMNGLNIAQDLFFRRGVFTDSIDKKLRRAGIIVDNPTKIGQYKSLEEFVAAGKTLPASVLSDSIEEALDFTFSRMPKVGGQKIGDTIGHHFIKFNDALGPVPLPIGTGAIPFARFMVNALQFQLEYSPLSFVTMLSKGGVGRHTSRMAEAAKKLGNTKEGTRLYAQAQQEFMEARQAFSKGVVGTAAFYAAVKYRSDHQDVKFYEYRTKDGGTGDLRPFFPLVPYLAVADLFVKVANGTTDKIDTKEIIAAFTGLQLRTGASSYVTDKFVDVLGGREDISSQRMAEIVGGYSAELFGGFLTPARVVRDIQASYDTEAATVRDPSQAEGVNLEERFTSAFSNYIKKDLPQFSKELPAVESPTREGNIYRQSPLIGQITGLRKEAKRNPAEEEFTRLGLKRFQIVPGSGDKTADALVKKYMGPLVEKEMSDFVLSESYQGLSEAKKRAEVNNKLKRYRAKAKLLAEFEAKKTTDKSYTPFDRAQFSRLTDIQERLANEYYMDKYGKSIIEMVEEEPNVNHYRRAVNIGRILAK